MGSSDHSAGARGAEVVVYLGVFGVGRGWGCSDHSADARGAELVV